MGDEGGNGSLQWLQQAVTYAPEWQMGFFTNLSLIGSLH
jgi:hypothetical protein